MDISSMTQIIMSVGFPIVACIAMGWYVREINNKHSDQIEKMNNQHHEEMKQVVEALNNNTLALQRLCDKLGTQKGE